MSPAKRSGFCEKMNLPSEDVDYKWEKVKQATAFTILFLANITVYLFLNKTTMDSTADTFCN
jgi:hypothetical protein